MSFFRKYFRTLELLDDDFFEDDFFSYSDPLFRRAQRRRLSFWDDPFFNRPLNSSLFYRTRDPFYDFFGDHFLLKEPKVDEEKRKKEKDEKDNDGSQYFYESSKYSANKDGVTRGISTRRSGDSETGKEKYSIRKTIGDKSFTITKEKKDGKEEISKDYKNIRKGEIDRFVNDWENFSIDKDMKPKKIEMKDEVKCPETEEIIEINQKKQKKKDKKEELDLPPNYFYTRTIKSTTVDGKTKCCEEIKEKSKDGEKHTVVKSIGDKKMIVKTSKNEKGEEKTVKKFEKMEEEDEGKFVKEWEEIFEKKDEPKQIEKKNEPKQIEKKDVQK